MNSVLNHVCTTPNDPNGSCKYANEEHEKEIKELQMYRTALFIASPLSLNFTGGS